MNQRFTKEQIEEAIKIGRTMENSAKVLGVNLRTFRKEAQAYDLYKPVIANETKIFTKEQIEEAIKIKKHMCDAAEFLQTTPRVFKREAEKYGLFNPLYNSNEVSLNEEEVKKAIESSTTMGGAAKILGIHHKTFRREAEKYGLYNPVGQSNRKFDLQDILNGNQPQYCTGGLKRRLIKEGIKKNKCEICGISEWNEKPITLELHHVDGDNSNHRLENLELICPNCHSQTDTYKFKSRNQ